MSIQNEIYEIEDRMRIRAFRRVGELITDKPVIWKCGIGNEVWACNSKEQAQICARKIARAIWEAMRRTD